MITALSIGLGIAVLAALVLFVMLWSANMDAKHRQWHIDRLTELVKGHQESTVLAGLLRREQNRSMRYLRAIERQRLLAQNTSSHSEDTK